MISGAWGERKCLSIRGHHQGQCRAHPLYGRIDCSGIGRGRQFGVKRTQVAKRRCSCRTIAERTLQNLTSGVRRANGLESNRVVIGEGEVERVRCVKWGQKVHRAPALAVGQQGR